MLFHMSREKCRKIKTLILLAILGVSEGRRVSPGISSAWNIESPVHGRYLDGPKHTTTSTAATKIFPTVNVDVKVQKNFDIFAKAIDAMLAAPKLQEQARLASEHLKSIMGDRGLLEQSALLVEQIEALATEPKVRGLLKLVKQVQEKLENDQNILELDHMEFLLQDPEVQAQAKLIYEELKAITEDKDFVKRVELASEQLKAIMEHPALGEHSKLFAQRIEAILTDSEVKERAAVAAEQLAALVEAINGEQTEVAKGEASSLVEVRSKFIPPLKKFITRKLIPLHPSARGQEGDLLGITTAGPRSHIRMSDPRSRNRFNFPGRPLAPPPPPPPRDGALQTLASRPSRAAMALAWVVFIVYVAAFSPGSFDSSPTSFDNQLIAAVFSNDASAVNPYFYAIFNALGVLPAVNLALLAPGSKGQKPLPMLPFVGASFAAGYGAIGPYLALREPRPAADAERGLLLTVTESKLYAAALLAATLALAYGVFTVPAGGAAATDFGELFATSKVVHVSTIDFAILSALVYEPIREDMNRRGWWVDGAPGNNAARLAAFAALPVLGPAAYLLLRPELDE